MSVITEVLEEAMKDPRWKAYEAGFNRAKGIYSSSEAQGGQLFYLTGALDYFVVWRSDHAASKRVDL